MKKSLTEGMVRALGAPQVPFKVHYDGSIPVFGLVITCKGGKSFSLDYTGTGGKRWPSSKRSSNRRSENPPVLFGPVAIFYGANDAGAA